MHLIALIKIELNPVRLQSDRMKLNMEETCFQTKREVNAFDNLNKQLQITCVFVCGCDKYSL